METFSRREKMLDLREQLLSGRRRYEWQEIKSYTIDELDKYLDDIMFRSMRKWNMQKYKVNLFAEKAKNMLASNIVLLKREV